MSLISVKDWLLEGSGEGAGATLNLNVTWDVPDTTVGKHNLLFLSI